MPELDAQFRPHPSVVFTQLDSAEAVLLNLDTKRYFSLNETGCRIWTLLQETGDLGEISSRIDEEYEVEAEDSRRHVTEFLETLRRQGLVEHEPSS